MVLRQVDKIKIGDRVIIAEVKGEVTRIQSHQEICPDAYVYRNESIFLTVFTSERKLVAIEVYKADLIEIGVFQQ